MSSKHGPRVRVDFNDLKEAVRRQPGMKTAVTLARVFKRACQHYGIGHMLKEKQFFIGDSQKRRRRKLKTKLALLKAQEEAKSPVKEWEENKYHREWED